MASFRVVSPFLAMTGSDKETFVIIPEGAIIETSDGLERPGFINITFEQQTLLAFARDLQERAQCLTEM